MSKTSKKIAKDYRGGKLSKLQNIADELIKDADLALEEAKDLSLNFVLKNGVEFDVIDKIKILKAKHDSNKYTAKIIRDLLGQNDINQPDNMDHIET